MRAVDVGIGHDDDTGGSATWSASKSSPMFAADSRDQRADGVAGKRAVQARALNVEDLAAQGQDSLRLAVAGLLGRAACGIALDDEAVRSSPGSWTSSRPACPAARTSLSTPLRRVISRALRAASRALSAWVALPMMRLAGVGFSSRYSARPWVTAFCTSGRISVLPSFVFVWPSNCGSCSFTDTMAAQPSRVSSPERLESFSLRMPFVRAYSLMARVSGRA